MPRAAERRELHERIGNEEAIASVVREAVDRLENRDSKLKKTERPPICAKPDYVSNIFELSDFFAGSGLDKRSSTLND